MNPLPADNLVDIPFDSIITLIVFLIGIPALVFQSMPPDVRHIIFERRRLFWFLLGFIFFPISSAFLISGVGIYTEINMANDPEQHALRWVIVLGIMVVIILIVAIYFPLKYSRRQGVMRLLEWEAVRSLESRGKLPEEVVEDVIELGKNAESPQEKGMVLQSIHNLVTKTCNHPCYKGDSLETLILRIHEIVIADSKPVSLENFRLIAETFQAIAVSRREIQHVADLQRTVKAAGGLGRAALMKFEFGLEVDNIIMSFVQTLGLINYVKPLDVINKQQFHVMTDVSEALFDIGSLAAKEQRDFIAVAALDKVTTMLSQSSIVEDLPSYVVDELRADVIGLMAHIWTEGDSQKEFILQKVPEIRACFELPSSVIFNKARTHYLSKSQFETANRIGQMATDPNFGNKPRRKK